MKKALHLFDSSLENESRLLKTTQVLLEWSLCQSVTVIGYWKPGLSKKEFISENRLFIRVELLINILSSGHWAMRNIFIRKFVAFWSIITFRYNILLEALQNKPNYVSVHNPTFLVTALLIRLFSRARILYVPHELESERTGIGGLQGKYVKFLERVAKPFIHHVILVSPEIEKWYKTNLGFSATSTIRNIPINPFYKQPIPQNNYLKNYLGLHREDILFIYQGIINQFRGIETLMDVFMSQKRCHIVFMGFGEMVTQVLKNSEKSPFIHYHSPVSMSQIINVTSSADVSLFFVDSEITLSYQLTTANKFYEGIIAGTPFVISKNFTYMSGENSINDLGWSLKPDIKELKKLINEIDMEMIKQKKEKCLKYGSEICWKQESKILKLIY